MLGIFQLAFELRDSATLPKYIEDELINCLEWLRMHLKRPDILDDSEHYRAICWFKDTAKEPLKRIWTIKSILEEAGYVVDLVKTNDPGMVIYSDGWQVVAKPG